LIQGEPALSTHAKPFEWVSFSAHHTSATRSSVTRRPELLRRQAQHLQDSGRGADLPTAVRAPGTTFGQVPTSRREDMSRERDRPRMLRTRFPFGPRSVAREGKAKADAGAPVNAANQRSSAGSADRSRIVRWRVQPTAMPRGGRRFDPAREVREATALRGFVGLRTAPLETAESNKALMFLRFVAQRRGRRFPLLSCPPPATTSAASLRARFPRLSRDKLRHRGTDERQPVACFAEGKSTFGRPLA
jgi:hypothetical protein